MTATVSPISLFSSVTKRWSLCPFSLEYRWPVTLDSVELTEWDHTTSKAKSEKAVSALLTLPCTLGALCYTEAARLGGRGQPHREATRRHSGRQVGHQSIPGVRHVSEGDFGWFRPPAVQSHHSGVKCVAAKPTWPFQILDTNTVKLLLLYAESLPWSVTWQ